MRKILKGIGSLFVDSGEETTAPTAPAAPAPAAEVTPAPAPAPASTILSSTGGTFNQEMFDGLMKTIIDNNIDGYDYLEFKDSLQKLTVPMSEADKYKAIFQTAQTIGVTIDTILNAIEHYLGVLEKEKENFDGVIEAQINTEITGREQKKTDNETAITEMTQQIQELNEKISAAQQENVKLSNEVNEQNLQISNVKSSFEITFQKVVSQITEDRTKIQTYLGTPEDAPEQKPETQGVE